MGWWLWLLPATGGSSVASGVSHIHNLGAVCIGEGGKAQFLGALCPQLGGRSEWLGAICPEIAGRSSVQGAEPLRHLPFGAIGTSGGHTHTVGVVNVRVGGYSEYIGAVCIELAGRSSVQGAEPLRHLPFGAIGTSGGHTQSIGSVAISDSIKTQSCGAVCLELAGRSSVQGAEPLRHLPFGAVCT